METADTLLAQIQSAGMLLHHDSVVRSVTTLVAGTPIAGSWWSHPDAHQIYALINTLASHPDLLVVKLVSAKATFLHRRLWPALLAVACAQESWQFATLSDAARALYAAVERDGVIQATGTVPKELERRLLVQSRQVHTQSGHHELQLTHWALWAAQVGAEAPLPVAMGRQQLEAGVQVIGGSAAMLPWNRKNGAKL